MGYLYTQFYSVTGDDEYWAPQHSPGADLDGDGILEFITYIADGMNLDVYVIDSQTGAIEFTHTWARQPSESIIAIVYLDVNAADGVSEVMVQTLHRIFVITGGSAVAVGGPDSDARETSALPATMPNPARDRVTMHLDLQEAGQVSIQIVDASGRLVRNLLEGRMDAGVQAIEWNGRDNAGRTVPAGVYFANIETRRGSSARRLVVAR
jgi:hypothetical protein